MANSTSTPRRKKTSSSSKQQQGRQKEGQQPPLRQRAQAVLAKLEKKDPGLKQLLKKAHGYAIFPSVGKAALVVGGAYGRGVVFEKGKMIGFATISQMTIGVQIGGDTFTEILVFHDKHQLDRFKHGHMAFAANASAVLVKAAAAGTTNFKGVTALAYSSGGMLLELALGGQKFNFKPLAGSGGGEEPGGASAKGKGRGAQSSQDDESGDGEEGSEDDEGGGMFGRAMDGLTKVTDMAKEHPIAATVVGAGLTTGLAFLLVRGLRSSVGGSGSDSDSEDQDDEESEDDTDARDQSDESSDNEDEDEQDDGEEEEDDDRGSSRLRRRSRSRA